MPFIIENNIFFSEIDNYIINQSTGQKIILPVTASVILLFLLENCGRTVSRDMIKGYVHEQLGYPASNNTLTQYISLIRKNLKQLGLATTGITTVPKVGFYINGSFVTKHEMSFDVKPSSSIDSPIESVELVNNRRLHIIFYITAPILTLSIAVLLIVLFSNNRYGVVVSPITAIDTCQIYTWGNNSPPLSELDPKYISEIAKDHLPCKGDSTYFLHNDIMVFHKSLSRIFLTRCEPGETSNGNDFSHCESVYIHAN